MIQSINQIIEETNKIIDGIIKHQKKENPLMSKEDGTKMRVAAIEATSKIMQSRVMALVIEDKYFN